MRGAIASPVGSPSAARSRRCALGLAALCASLLLLASAASPAFASPARTYGFQITGFSNDAVAGLAVDSSDNLWVADTYARGTFDSGISQVSKYDSSGNLLHQSAAAGPVANSLYVQDVAWSNAANKLFAADSATDDLWGLNPDASYAHLDLSDGLGGGCCYIYDAVDNSGGAGDGDIYVANGASVVRIDSSGSPVDFTAGADAGTNTLSGADAPGGPFGNAEGLAVDSSGKLYVADAGNNVIDVFNSDGSYDIQITGTPAPFGGVSSVAIDPTNGDILVLDSGNGVVDEFDSSGNFQFAIDGSDTPAGSLGNPQDLALDSHGNLWVSDAANGVVDFFGPPPPPEVAPTIDSTSASDLTQSSATLNAQIKPGFAPTLFRFRYGTDASYGSSTLISDSIGSDNTDHAVSAEIGGLAPATTYHYQAVAIHFTDTVHGPDQTFTTPAVPLVSSSSASAITQTSATLGASINPRLSSTTYHFEYGTSSAYGQSTSESAPLGADSSAHPGSADITGLSAGTVYHYRVVATNAVGATDGPDQTFTTAAPPPVVTPPPPPTTCKPGFVKKQGQCVKKKTHRKRKHHKRSARHG